MQQSLLMTLLLLLFSLLALPPKSSVSASFNGDIQLALIGLKAVQNMAEVIYDLDVFERTSIVRFDGLVGKILTCIAPFIALVDDKNMDSNDLLIINAQFQEDHIRLDSVQVSVTDIEAEELWKGKYDAKYASIIANSQQFESYLNLPDRKLETPSLVKNLATTLLAPLYLYNGIVSVNPSMDLKALAMRVTRNHRRKVMSSLLAVTRAILRGAELNIANEMLRYGAISAANFVTAWQQKLKKVAISLREVDNMVRDIWHKQMEEDVHLAVKELGSLTSEGFAAQLYDQLSEKFYWRSWLVMVYKERDKDSPGNDRPEQNHVWHCSGIFISKALMYGRHVVVASSETRKSLFKVRHAVRVLATTERNGPETDSAYAWWRHVSQRFGTGCESAAFIGAVCFGGCDAVWVAQPDRMAYRRMSVGKYSVNFVVFG